MNKNEQIIESLNRAKLLMGYKSSMTLTENVKTLKNSFISESILIAENKPLLNALFGTADDAVRIASVAAKDLKYTKAIGTIDDAMRNTTKKITDTSGKALGTADDIIKAMESGTLSKTGFNNLKSGMLKSSGLGDATKKELIAQAIKEPRNLKKYKGLTKKEIKDDLISKGYNPQLSDELAGEFTKLVGKTPPVGGKVLDSFKKVKELYGSSRAFRWLVRGGLGYLAYKMFMAEGSSPFPDCIRKKITEEEFIKQNGENSDGSVLISKTGIETIDTVGGGKFYDNKDFKTGNGKYEGTWNDTGSGIVITINGTDYAMSCDNTQDNEDTEDTEDEGNEDEGGVITYRNCSSAPFGLGCISNDIKFVQSCLGIEPVDGKLGPITKSGLKDNGYSVPLSQSDLDKIKKECTSSNQDTPVDPLSGEQSLEAETGDSPSFTSQEPES